MVKKETKKLNKFEKTRLLSARALELAFGSKPTIKIKKEDNQLTKDYVKIAEAELAKDKLELDIYRN